MVGEDNEVSVVPGGSTGNTKMPTLEEYGTNLTKLAEEVRNLFICFILWVFVCVFFKQVFLPFRVNWILLLGGRLK